MSEKIKNKKNLIIGIGIIALVAIVIGVVALIKGNNDISGMGKNAKTYATTPIKVTLF